MEICDPRLITYKIHGRLNDYAFNLLLTKTNRKTGTDLRLKCLKYRKKEIFFIYCYCFVRCEFLLNTILDQRQYFNYEQGVLL